MNTPLGPASWRENWLRPDERQELDDARAYVVTAPHHVPSATLMALVALVEADQVPADWRDTLGPAQLQLVGHCADIALCAGDITRITIAKLVILLDARIQRPVPTVGPLAGRGLP